MSSCPCRSGTRASAPGRRSPRPRDLLDRPQQRLVRRLLEDVALRARLEPRPSSERSLYAVKISTACPGPSRVRIFVASSPSMPGMRTSMITTSGRRRSASATALAPSDASPITRMCGARESDSRSPSRTTSWSSTIRQVISAGVDTVQDCIPAIRSALAARARRRARADAARVADPVLARELETSLRSGFSGRRRDRPSA
jgi:hypothetical protein